MTPRSSSYDVVVIGTGPAGTAAASLLAESGRRVAMIEKLPLPRYRIGESLIPWCWFPLTRLGLVAKLDSARFAVRKVSVQFATTEGKRSTPFYFEQHSDHPSARTWQVVRSEFDRMLLDNATGKGAELFDKTEALELLRDGFRVTGVRTRAADGRTIDFEARVTIDASGRETFAQSQNDWRITDPVLRKVAIWTYFDGARRDPGKDAGATTIAYLPGKGWIWYIPLPDDRTSVGVVAEKEYLFRDERDPDVVFDREVKRQPWIEEHVASGRKVEPCRVTGNFSYRSRFSAEDGLVLAGDAFAFLDPVFSSGVMLALHSGVMVADAVHDALAANDVSAGRFRAYSEKFCTGIESMRRLVYAFYDTRFSFSRFLRDHPELRDDLTDCLIGNIGRDYRPLFEAVGRYADVPTPLEYGRPLRR